MVPKLTLQHIYIYIYLFIYLYFYLCQDICVCIYIYIFAYSKITFCCSLSPFSATCSFSLGLLSALVHWKRCRCKLPLHKEEELCHLAYVPVFCAEPVLQELVQVTLWIGDAEGQDIEVFSDSVTRRLSRRHLSVLNLKFEFIFDGGCTREEQIALSLKRHLFPHAGRKPKALWICFSTLPPPSWIFFPIFRAQH